MAAYDEPVAGLYTRYSCGSLAYYDTEERVYCQNDNMQVAYVDNPFLNGQRCVDKCPLIGGAVNPDPRCAGYNALPPPADPGTGVHLKVGEQCIRHRFGSRCAQRQCEKHTTVSVSSNISV